MNPVTDREIARDRVRTALNDLQEAVKTPSAFEAHQVRLLKEAIKQIELAEIKEVAP